MCCGRDSGEYGSGGTQCQHGGVSSSEHRAVGEQRARARRARTQIPEQLVPVPPLVPGPGALPRACRRAVEGVPRPLRRRTQPVPLP